VYEKVTTLIAACLYYIGWVALARWWMQRQGPRLMILRYHTATGGDLERHLLYLRRHYRLMHLEDALEELFSPSSHQAQDRRTPLVITFDDGYYDNFTHCLALACDLHIPMTIFLIPGYIESGDRFWWQEPDYLVTNARVNKVMIEGQMYHLNKSAEAEALRRTIDARIRFASSVREREAYLSEMRQFLDAPYGVTRAERMHLPMSWVQVEAMNRCEWISFGSHTMHHPILAQLTDPCEVEYEALVSRLELEHHLETAVRSFAYPIGKFEDIEEQGVRSVQEAGYSWALTTIPGWNTPLSDPYLLNGLSVDVGQHWLLIAAMVSDVRHLFPNLLRTAIRFLLDVVGRTHVTDASISWLAWAYRGQTERSMGKTSPADPHQPAPKVRVGEKTPLQLLPMTYQRNQSDLSRWLRHCTRKIWRHWPCN
jgi:peptidoglycan/xylan/chitin deacetylase (PgdA/CDA1 family)